MNNSKLNGLQYPVDSITSNLDQFSEVTHPLRAVSSDHEKRLQASILLNRFEGTYGVLIMTR